MRGMTNTLTIGERVAWYRRRRGVSQEILASIVGRTVDWLSKVENNRIELDRLSVIKALADALDVSLGDLLAEPSLADWTPFGGHASPTDAPSLAALGQWVSDLWDAYQASRFGYVTARLPGLLQRAQAA